MLPTPAGLIDHVTAGLALLFTVAVNCCVWVAKSVTFEGDTLTVIPSNGLPLLPKFELPLMYILSATNIMYPLALLPVISISSLAKYSAPFNTVVEPPLIWSTHEPLVEQPLRLPKNRMPSNAPLVGANNVAVTCPLIVIGV